MKLHVLEVPIGNKQVLCNSQKGILLALAVLLLTIIPLSTNKNLPSSLSYLRKNITSLDTVEGEKKCDVFRGNWVPKPGAPLYYTNETCDMMFDYQNCLKFGRTNKEFLKWRWKPNGCELPLFDSARFLEIVKGKSLAFVGDSVARNHMQSLLCLLANVSHPEDISQKLNLSYDFQRWFYPDYNFTIARFWSPYLVKSKDADQNGFSANSLMNVYLDEPDESWTSEIESFDFIIFSVGQWFFRPQTYYENGRIAGCYGCGQRNITQLWNHYGYGRAFRTAFRTILGLKNFTGIAFLRTFSPSHFENGEWNTGGNCGRTQPISREEMEWKSFVSELHRAQVEEFREAEAAGRKLRRRFRLLDTTEAMLMRPDGHPNHDSPRRNGSIADCVHWCLPGPIDTWNELLLYELNAEREDSEEGLEKNR